MPLPLLNYKPLYDAENGNKVIGLWLKCWPQYLLMFRGCIGLGQTDIGFRCNSIEQVLNVLSRLNDLPIPAQVETSLKLNEEPLADTARL